MGYVDRMRAKSPAKWGVHLAGMNFQTRSRSPCIKKSNGKGFRIWLTNQKVDLLTLIKALIMENKKWEFIFVSADVSFFLPCGSCRF